MYEPLMNEAHLQCASYKPLEQGRHRGARRALGAAAAGPQGPPRARLAGHQALKAPLLEAPVPVQPDLWQEGACRVTWACICWQA